MKNCQLRLIRRWLIGASICLTVSAPTILMLFIIGLSTWHQVSTVESFSWITSPSSFLGLTETNDE